MTNITEFPWQPGALLKAACGLSAVPMGTLIDAGDAWDDREFVPVDEPLMVLGFDVEEKPCMYSHTRAVLMHVLLGCGNRLTIPIPVESLYKEALRWFEVIT
jgi:hypothetical protein